MTLVIFEDKILSEQKIIKQTYQLDLYVELIIELVQIGRAHV